MLPFGCFKNYVLINKLRKHVKSLKEENSSLKIGNHSSLTYQLLLEHSKLKQVHRPEVNVFRNTQVFYKSTNILKIIIYMNHLQTHGKKVIHSFYIIKKTNKSNKKNFFTEYASISSLPQ